MHISPFRLERYLELYEFSAKYILGASDCESFEIQEILSSQEFTELKSLRLGYSEAQGSLSLRKEISNLFQLTEPEHIVVSVPQEGIFITMNALLIPGDKVIVQVPCYQSLCEMPKALGCEVLTWEPETENRRWEWNLDFLRKNVDRRTKLIVVNSPQNPTGQTFDKDDYLEILELAKRNACYVFSDEMYRLLEHNPQDRLPIGTDIYEKCISLSGMSKTFGLGGLRLGWLSTRDYETLKRIVEFKDYTTISNNAVGEYIAKAALKKKNILLSRNHKIVTDNVALLDSFFAKHKDLFGWFKPRAGSIAFVETKFNENADDFCADLLKKKDVLLVPSTKFGYGEHHFRLGFGRKNMQEGITLLGQYIDENMKR
jgi:aspartate/methionine/tyrosine aminotransferase